MTRLRSSERGKSGPGDRGQIVLVAAAVVAVALLSMTLAYAQLGYDADRTGAGTVGVASPSEIDRSLTGSLRAAAREVRRADDARTWRDRRRVADRVRRSLTADSDRLERVHAEESRSLAIGLDNAAATRWARERCPEGRGRDFGPCLAINGVVVQERADETVVVAAAFRIRVVSPAESTTAISVARVVPTPETRSRSRIHLDRTDRRADADSGPLRSESQPAPAPPSPELRQTETD